MYDIDSRENDITALDTKTALTEKGADSPGAFVVPSHASKITEIRISAVPDYTADAIEGFTSAVWLHGPGLKPGESYIPGPTGLTVGGSNVAPGNEIVKPQVYYCNIPVNPGQTINADGFMHGSADPGSIRMMVTLVYDGPIAGRWSTMDYREGDTASANTPVELTARAGSAEGAFKPGGKKIVEVVIGVGGVVVAGPLAATTAVELSGGGLMLAGNYFFQGPGIYTQDDVASLGQGAHSDLVKYETDIGTKVNESIKAKAQEIEDDVGTPSHIIGLGYA